jgi:hypothetical protein
VGDRSLARYATGSAYRQLLVELLARDYPADHEVIIYRGATLPIERPRVRRITLSELAHVSMTPEETVVLPPAETLRPNVAMQERLDALDKLERANAPG